MSASPEFIEFVRELLLPLGELKDGKFFGGFAFKSGTKQFAMIMGNTLYFCVNAHTREKYEALGMEPFSYSTKKGKVNVKKYYSVPDDFFEDNEQLVAWANEAIESAYSYK
ncbi:MAG: TfoX/Sxy family protein [Ectothiorhodospiraceae bacterium]|nr:TfoX/Sxy family protein [Ectothiorhodospiraceae bacterium]